MPYISANGIRLHYEEYGEGEPLVLLAGLASPLAVWEPHVNAYKEHFRCICIDNRGVGASDKPEAEAYSTLAMAEDTIALMDALGIDSAHVNGISMGGAIAQHLAIRWPKRVRSLILTVSFARNTAHAQRALEILQRASGVLDASTMCRLAQWMVYSPAYHAAHLDTLLELEAKDAANQDRQPTYAYRAQAAACRSHDTFAQLPEIAAPTLVAAGAVDLFCPMQATMELADNIPGAKLYVCEGSGHAQHREHLAAYNAATLEFLLRQRRAGAGG